MFFRTALVAAFVGVVVISARSATPHFYPDDPIAIDDDTGHDPGDIPEIELSEGYDFLANTFGKPGDQRPTKALNANTLDEVPNSSWFTNRIGVRAMSVDEITRGPDKFEGLDTAEWVIVRGKGPGGFQPGFRAVDPRHREQEWQLEVDPPDNPEMATGAEVIGTKLYHALGFNTVDVYTVYVDPNKVTVDPTATIRDASGRRRFARADFENILALGAKEPDGRYRMSATRLVEGKNLGRFGYYGTRSDDPNDVYPHEHRRELRANRVFCAWMNHDDSRAVNTRNMLVEENGRRYVRHYIYDFGSILGSATRFPDHVRSGHEWLVEKGPSLKALASLGFYVRPWLRRVQYADDPPPAAGRIEGDSFEPALWKAEYPNAAFRNMRPDDAFWGARLVASFTDDQIRAAVDAARFKDPRATDYLTGILIKRRDKIAKVWLNGVNPVVNVALAEDGTLTFDNAAIKAHAATPGGGYTLAWSRFDNATDTHTPVGGEITVVAERAHAPADLLSGSEFISVTVRGRHDQHAAWAQPVRVYFRREGTGWKTVGLERN